MGQFKTLAVYNGHSYQLLVSPFTANEGLYSFVLGAKNENGLVVGSASTSFASEVPTLTFPHGPAIELSRYQTL